MTRLAATLAAAALTLTACAAAGGDPETSDTPRRDLAERPTPIAGSDAGSRSGSPSGEDTEPRGSGAASAPAGATTDARRTGSPRPGDPTAPQPDGASPAKPFHGIATLTDGSRDALGGPAYADLRSVTLADNGTTLRVTLVVDAALPARTADGETMGIGVDLYPPGHGRESDYQLFADGEPDGWFAYLDTPDGFVRYPGTFGLGGGRVVFTLPWSAVGNPRIGRVSAFVDWTERSAALTGNEASNDYAPALGTKVYAR
jgi:hypothetical protein